MARLSHTALWAPQPFFFLIAGCGNSVGAPKTIIEAKECAWELLFRPAGAGPFPTCTTAHAGALFFTPLRGCESPHFAPLGFSEASCHAHTKARNDSMRFTWL